MTIPQRSQAWCDAVVFAASLSTETRYFFNVEVERLAFELYMAKLSILAAELEIESMVEAP